MRQARLRVFLIICVIILGVGSLDSALARDLLEMGYRDSNREPYMNAPPDNSGFYFDLYSRALESIDCDLEIVRKPKKRILMELENGEVDFYPEYNFTEERAKHVFFIPTGLTKKLVGISHKDLPEIKNLSQLKGYTAIVSLGSINRFEGLDGVSVLHVPNVSLEKAALLIKKKRAEFYTVRLGQILYFLKKNPEYREVIKIDSDCCGDEQETYLAFSKKSSYYRDRTNPTYNLKQPIQPGNYPAMLEPGTIPYKLQMALGEMANNGHTRVLFEKHFAPQNDSQ